MYYLLLCNDVSQNLMAQNNKCIREVSVCQDFRLGFRWIFWLESQKTSEFWLGLWSHLMALPSMWAWAGQMEVTAMSTDQQVYYHALNCASLRVPVQSVVEQCSVRLDFSQPWWVVQLIRIDVVRKNKDIQYHTLHAECCHTCIGTEPYFSNTLTPHKRKAKRLVVCLCLRLKHAAAC